MYIQLNSQIISYEKTGEGKPVILLHGNNEDHHIFDALASKLELGHTVYAMDSRGCGESATPKEYHYSDMADDVLNLIRALDIRDSYIIGFSDGAIVALLVAIRASYLLKGIVCCGANLSPDGIKHSDLKEMKREYKKTLDPKLKMMLEEPNIDTKMLGQIEVPAFILAGENDCIKEKETEKIAKAIPNGKMLILSGEDHYSYVVQNAMLYDYIHDFLK